MLIRLEHLRKEYPEATPLKDVSCDINRGDVIAVIGPSGTGKSTLLYTINRMVVPTSGKIWFDGEDTTAPGYDINRMRRRMGMVFQSFNLFSHLTVAENIMLAPVELLGMSRQEAYKRAIGLLDSVGLADKALHYPWEMSGGQQQRVAIVRALAMDPEVLLFDEPTSALDPTMVGEVQSVIRNLAKQGLTMLIVTHEMKFAHDVSNRVFFMDEGGIYEDGSPEQIFGHPQRSRTRQFIQQLKVFSWTVSREHFDFPAMNTAIEKYGYQQMMEPKLVGKLLRVAEELCVQELLPFTKGKTDIEFSFEYSQDDSSVSMRISYGGEPFNPLEREESLPIVIARNAVENLCYGFSDGLNVITALLTQ